MRELDRLKCISKLKTKDCKKIIILSKLIFYDYLRYWSDSSKKGYYDLVDYCPCSLKEEET